METKSTDVLSQVGLCPEGPSKVLGTFLVVMTGGGGAGI
jgi:hypothetical protein